MSFLTSKWDLPMGQTRHDLAFYILLYVSPRLTFFRWAGWKKLAEVPRGDIGHDPAVRDGIIVVDD